jgi:hypothetical protein
MSIAFESFGVPKSSKDSEHIRNILTNSFVGYKLTYENEEPFQGGTLAGELRILCGIKSYGDVVINPYHHRDDFFDCGPNFIRRNHDDLNAVALHANYGTAYNKKEIYPLIGFNKTVFINDLRKMSISNCGSYQFTACDDAVLDKLTEISKDFENKKHMFI